MGSSAKIAKEYGNGITFEQSENGDCTLNASFDDGINYEGIQLEVNGQLVE